MHLDMDKVAAIFMHYFQIRFDEIKFGCID